MMKKASPFHTVGLAVLIAATCFGHAAAQPPSTAPAAPAGPLAPSSADDIREALLAASEGEAAMRRLIDPAWGVGSYDPEQSGVLQHCSEGSFTSHSGLSFTVRDEDRFACDRSLRRCTAQDPDSGGYVFHFRDGPGQAVYLNTIIHHRSRVPTVDSAAVRDFVRSGDGVCALYRNLHGGGSAPSQLSVFIASHTGLVERSVREDRCAEAAGAAYGEHVAPVASAGAPSLCERSPTRCTFSARDTTTTVYGDAQGTVTAVALTRPGMFPNLERVQQRELSLFVRGLGRRRCD